MKIGDLAKGESALAILLGATIVLAVGVTIISYRSSSSPRLDEFPFWCRTCGKEIVIPREGMNMEELDRKLGINMTCPECGRPTMDLMETCPKCGEPYRGSPSECPHCGVNMLKYSVKRKK